jgi:hypothetical protein
MECLLAKMDAIQAKTDINLMKKEEDIRTSQTKADATLNEMKVELTARLEVKIKAEIKSNNEKSDVL